MNKKALSMLGIALLLAGSVSAQYTNTVYSESNDGIIEYRDGWVEATNHWENGSSEYGTIGEWYGTNGLVCTVLPFQLPNLGIVTNPFTASSLKVFLERNDLITDVDLYYVRTDAGSDLIATNDYYSGTNDTSATRIEAAFISTNSGVNVFLTTDTAASSNLLDAVNAAYDDGAGAGDYVFLRLSYSSEMWPTNSESAAIFTRNNAAQVNWPTLMLENNADSDSDGLPNWWEIANNLAYDDGTGDNGASGDPDGDGKTNAQEFADGTDPNSFIDGILDTALYGDPVATQSVNTAWGDNENELNAAYTYVADGRFHLMLTGNINSWNKLEIFFDTTDAVTTNVLDTIDYADDGWKLDGMTFDTGFEPDYHCFFRRDGGAAYFDIIDLAAQTNSGYGSLFAGEGAAKTGTGPANDYYMEVGYDDSNVAGVTNGTAAAAPQHWTNSLYGLELSIDLRDLGDPSGTVKLVAVINGANRDYLSNQMLGGLPAGTDQLGGDMAGGWDGTLTNINFNALAGDQFFAADVGGIPQAGPFSIGSISAVSGGLSVELELMDLTVGASYKVQEATSLTNAFSDVAGSGFTAADTNATVVLTATNGAAFFKAVSPQ